MSDVSSISGPEPPAPGTPVPDDVITQLARVSGWVRFMAVLGFISAGLLAVCGLVVMAIGLPQAGAAGRLVGLVYLVVGGIYLIPALPLNQAASAAARLRLAPSHATAVEALRYQASFWRRIGIMSIVGIALMVIALIVGLFAALALRNNFS